MTSDRALLFRAWDPAFLAGGVLRSSVSQIIVWSWPLCPPCLGGRGVGQGRGKGRTGAGTEGRRRMASAAERERRGLEGERREESGGAASFTESRAGEACWRLKKEKIWLVLAKVCLLACPWLLPLRRRFLHPTPAWNQSVYPGSLICKPPL